MQTSPATSQLSPPESFTTPYPLLTTDEALFHACLENLASQRCHVQCKPRLLEILHPESVAGFLKICQRHIDFLIYRKGDWLPMVAIEFEDGSPGKATRKIRDRQLVNDIFSTFGIPVVQFQAKEIIEIDSLVYKLSTAWQERNANLAIMPTPSEVCAPNPPTSNLLTASTTSRLTQPVACSAIS